MPRKMNSALIALVWVELTGRARLVPGSPRRGECFVADEEAVADGNALFGEDSGERGDGAGLRSGLPGLAGFARVDGEHYLDHAALE
jgi:hypothetical protein